MNSEAVYGLFCKKIRQVTLFAFVCGITSILLSYGITATSAEQESASIIKYDRRDPDTIHIVCPLIYSIEIFENGLVVFTGLQNVTSRGERRSQISKEEVARLKERFRTIKFFEMKMVERNPNTGAVKHDCNQDPGWLMKYGLADLCKGKDSIERFERFRVERSTESTLFFKDGNRSRHLKIYDVSMGVDLLNGLAREINEVAGAQKWIEPACQATK